ncbi:MAG: 30S ribosomal protein S12 methylthiotransferase RimO [Burkholderiales bacterium]
MARKPPAAPPRVGFVSLGCPKALTDSEQILTRLKAEGYAIEPTYEGADLVVVNTCGFIDSAVAESLDAIGEALSENGKVIVTGCLGAKDGGGFVRQAHPKVLAVTGPHATDEVMGAVHAHLPKPHDPFVDLVPPQGVKLTPRHYAYLKISEGCNHRCTFCIIPSMRGDLVSRPLGEVLAEAERLLRAGVKELLVISQDTSAYGVDVRYRTGFWQGRPVKTRMTELARELDQLGRAHRAWVRLHYVYPYPHVDDVIALMADDVSKGGLVPYLDVPFQHASPRILKLMKRPAAPERVLERVRAWRAAKPDLAIRSTFIVGFPGETEAEFEELLAFLRDAGLDRVGCFAYSPVDGAAANALPDPVDPDEREARRARFMQTQAAVSAARLARRVGRTIDVLVDGYEDTGRGKSKRRVAIARSAAEAPEIDGVVRVEDGGELPVGTFARVTVLAAGQHDLEARLDR